MKRRRVLVCVVVSGLAMASAAAAKDVAIINARIIVGHGQVIESGTILVRGGKIIGPNAARYVGLGDQIGTLEPGELADIILLDGNPTLNIYEMLKTKVVLKEGKAVIDNVSGPRMLPRRACRAWQRRCPRGDWQNERGST